MSARPCAEIRPLLSEHLEGELPAGADASVRAHLAECAGCRARLELLRRTVGALRRLPDLPAPAGLLAGVRGRLRPEPWHRRLTGGRPWLVGVPAGALATLLVVVGVALFQARYPELHAPVVEAPVTPPVGPARPPSEARPAPPPAAPLTRPATTARQASPEPPPTVPSARPAPPAAPATPPVGATPAAEPRPEPAAPPPPTSRPSAWEVKGTAERGPAVATGPPAPAPSAARPSPWAPAPESEVSRPPSVAMPEAGAWRRPADGLQVRRGRALSPEAAGFRGAGGRESGPSEAFVPPPEETGGGPRRVVGARSRGTEPAPPEGAPRKETARRPAAFDAGSGPAGGFPLARSASGRGRVFPATRAALALALPADGDVEEVRRLVQGAEGIVVEKRAVDPGASAAARRHRLRPGAPRVTRAWELTARIPYRAVPRLLENLQRRPGVRILERPALPAAAGAEGQMELGISVLQ